MLAECLVRRGVQLVDASPRAAERDLVLAEQLVVGPTDQAEVDRHLGVLYFRAAQNVLGDPKVAEPVRRERYGGYLRIAARRGYGPALDALRQLGAEEARSQ